MEGYTREVCDYPAAVVFPLSSDAYFASFGSAAARARICVSVCVWMCVLVFFALFLLFSSGPVDARVHALISARVRVFVCFGVIVCPWCTLRAGAGRQRAFVRVFICVCVCLVVGISALFFSSALVPSFLSLALRVLFRAGASPNSIVKDVRAGDA